MRLACTGAVLATGVLLDACLPRARPQPPAPLDPVVVRWGVTLDSAQAAIAAGQPAHADSVLSAFRDRYLGMPQSAEALYWRALARLDLPAVTAGVQAALADLDAYRATAAPAHLVEATVLRRALAQLDSTRVAAAAVPPTSAERVQPNGRLTLLLRDTLRARDEELQRARADAAAAQAELERVRRRLAAPGRRPY